MRKRKPKRCGLCGYRPSIEQRGDGHSIRCQCGTWSSLPGRTRQQAIAVWNGN